MRFQGRSVGISTPTLRVIDRIVILRLLPAVGTRRRSLLALVTVEAHPVTESKAVL